MNHDELDLFLPPTPTARALPAAVLDRRRAHLVTEIGRPPSRRSTARLTVVTGTVALTLLGGTAAAFVAFAPATTAPQTARCYSTLTHDESDTFPGTSVTLAEPTDGTQVGFNALNQCTAIWRAGILQVGTPGTVIAPNPGATHPVPTLTACRLDNGYAAVFPGDTATCAHLGLPQLATS